MINWLMKAIIPQIKPDLDVVLEKIAKQESIKSATIAMAMDGSIKDMDVTKDLNFMVGKKSYFSGVATFKYFRVLFNTGDTKCIITMVNDNEPLFMFDNPDEVKQIRQAIINKYNK